MSDPDARMFWLRDQRLVSVALSSMPAWLWSIDASRILWANPIGAAIFGAPNPATLARRTFDLGQPAAAQIAQFAATMPMGTPRIEHLRGFGAGIGRTLACRCSRVMLEDGADALLVDALERSGPELPIRERAQRLLAECAAPVAIVSAKGDILHGTPAALLRMAGTRALTFPGSEALIDDARRIGHAEGRTASGPITIDRIGAGDILSFVATFGPPIAGRGTTPEVVAALPQAPAAAHAGLPGAAEAPEPVSVTAFDAESSGPPPSGDVAAAASPRTDELSEVGTDPSTVPEHRYPLRFIWQTDAEDRFTILSEDFLELVGAPTAPSMGRPWSELSATLGIDPDGEVRHALSSAATWSGIAVPWPVEGDDVPLTVELSGLPVLDRTKATLGYRGFGVCRDIAHLNALAGAVRQSRPRRHPRSDRPREPDESPSAAPAMVVAAAVPEPKAPSLTPRERHAFRELSRRLSEGLNGLAGAAAAQGGPGAPDRTDTPAMHPSGSINPFSGKTDVLATLGHGIRTQLNAICGFSEVMMDGQFGPVGNERYRLYLMDIQTSANQLIALMNDLFALSNITSGDIDLSFKGVALNDVTQACLGLMQQRARRERTIVRSALAHRLPQVVADAPSVQQMVLNLLGNSIRSAGAGGQTIITTALSDGGDVVLRVRDSGIAMTAKDIAIALEPLRQFAVSSRFGNGLELALTKALAEANHASFHITSERDTGTLIEVTFPAAQVLAR